MAASIRTSGIATDPSDGSSATINEASVTLDSISQGLTSAQNMFAEIDQQLESFATAAKSEDDDSFGPLCRSIGDATSAFESYSDPDQVSTIRQGFQEARANLLQIRRKCLLLSAVSSLSRTTAASYKIDTLDAYLDDLGQTTENIKTATESVSEQLDTLEQREQADAAHCENARSALSEFRPKLERRTESLTELGREEAGASERIVTVAQSIETSGKSEMRILASSTKFSEELSHRLARITDMLSYRGDYHVRQLAAAHARAAAQEIEQMCATTLAAIERLAQVAQDSLAHIGGNSMANVLREALETRERTVKDVEECLVPIRPAIAAAADASSAAKVAMNETGRNFDVLEWNAKKVAAASVNSTLLATRSGAARGPLSTLSQEVHETSAQCLAALNGCRDALNALRTANETRHDKVISCTDGLETSVEAFQMAVTRDGERLAVVDTLQRSTQESLTNLARTVETSRQDLTRVKKACSEFYALSQNLVSDHKGEEKAMDKSRLDSIWNTYTYDSERRIHTQTLGGSSDQPSTPPPNMDEEMFF